MNELELFPTEVDHSLDLLFINFGATEELHCLSLVKKVRDAGISCELYPSAAKMKKQMKYANDSGVKNIALVGQNEIDEGCVMIKNMHSGEQEKMTIEEAINRLKK